MIKNLLINLKPYFKVLVDKLKNLPKPNFHHKLVEIFRAEINRRRNISQEVPNLSYIKTLSNTDIEFHNEFLKTLSEEYSSDLRAYLFCIENGAPRAAASKVSKLKDKLNILGMKNAFSFAERHQRKLQKGNKSSDRKFKKILARADHFLNKQQQIYKLVN
ncbi:hypothetical protein [Maribacter sp. 2308TA10-17]|uniref:hypothetical protein n=1 Tax=Maribacter sp. 2308TA10-17 TaxID=3386276 RepID=UPI0039BCCB8B